MDLEVVLETTPTTLAEAAIAVEHALASEGRAYSEAVLARHVAEDAERKLRACRDATHEAQNRLLALAANGRHSAPLF